MTSSPARVEALRALGVVPLSGNLDHASTLKRLSGVASHIVHLAPPTPQGACDTRMRTLLRSLRGRTLPRTCVYASTSGVYGDCEGQWVSEVRSLQAQTPRAKRRVDAESQLRLFGRSTGTVVGVLRIPGIYAPDREGGTPAKRLTQGVPVLQAADDVYTNHIHANDLARACCLALWRAAPQRIYNVNDDTVLKMGDYFDVAADLLGLPRPPRISRTQALLQLPPTMLSFMAESRRLDNRRMKWELGLRLRYPTVGTGLLAS